MAGADQADPVLGKQQLLIEAAAQPGNEADRQVRLADLQSLLGIAVDPRDLQPHPGRHLAQLRQDPRQQGDVAGIAQAEAKQPLGGGGLEGDLPGYQPAQGFEHLATGGDQGLGLGRGLHAARRAHEQRIAQLLAQLAQPEADGGLALTQLFGGPGHAAGAIEHLEQHQQLGFGQAVRRQHYQHS